MLDTSLTWDSAKAQCGEGEEQTHEIPPRDDAALHILLLNEFRRAHPNQSWFSVEGFVSFIQALPYVKDFYDKHLYHALYERSMRWTPAVDIPGSVEILFNALTVQAPKNKATMVRYYLGETGIAYATENDPPGPSVEEVQQCTRNGLRGNGWPFLLTESDSRVGIEQMGEVYRVTIARTVPDIVRHYLPFARELDTDPPRAGSRLVVEGTSVPAFSRNSSSCPNRCDSLPQPDIEADMFIIRLYRTAAWKRLAEICPELHDGKEVEKSVL